MAAFDASDVDETTMNEFAQRTIEVAPTLKPVLAEHIADYDEILAHVYFGDVSQWVADEVSKPAPTTDVFALLDLFEASYPTADFYVQNLIDVSFIEMVQDEPDVVRLLGPLLLSRVDPEYRPAG